VEVYAGKLDGKTRLEMQDCHIEGFATGFGLGLGADLPAQFKIENSRILAQHEAVRISWNDSQTPPTGLNGPKVDFGGGPLKSAGHNLFRTTALAAFPTVLPKQSATLKTRGNRLTLTPEGVVLLPAKLVYAPGILFGNRVPYRAWARSNDWGLAPGDLEKRIIDQLDNTDYGRVIWQAE
jgi:hypothetical protein